VHPESRLPESTLAHHSRGTFTTNPGAASDDLNQQGALKTHHVKVFAKQVAGELERCKRKHQYKNLILVASPQFLGLLRKKFAYAGQ